MNDIDARSTEEKEQNEKHRQTRPTGAPETEWTPHTLSVDPNLETHIRSTLPSPTTKASEARHKSTAKQIHVNYSSVYFSCYLRK